MARMLARWSKDFPDPTHCYGLERTTPLEVHVDPSPGTKVTAPRAYSLEGYGIGWQPLPLRPSFPVYGLGSGYGGARQLGAWSFLLGDGTTDPMNVLSEIQLNHGRQSSEFEVGRGVFVTTWLKYPTISLTSGETKDGLTPDHVAVNAQVAMLELADKPSAQPARSEWWREQLEIANKLSFAFDDAHWINQSISVDGEPRDIRMRMMGDVWAAVADLDSVMVGMAGIGLRVRDYGLNIQAVVARTK